MRTQFFLISLLVTLLTAVSASPALAQMSDKQIDEFPVYELVSCIDYSDFDYQIDFDDMWTLTQTTFYSKDGSINRVQGHVKFEGTVTNLETGTTFRDKASARTRFYPNGEFQDHGVSLNLHYPGVGIVAKQSGRVIFDPEGTITFVAGQGYDKEYQQVACEGLVGL